MAYRPEQSAARQRIRSQAALPDILRRFLPELLSFLVFAVALGIAIAVWRHTQEIARQEMQSGFDTRVQEITGRIEHQLDSYMLVLRGARGWLLAADSVGPGRFREYVETLHLQANYPGIQSIAYSIRQPRAEHAIYDMAGRRLRMQSGTAGPADDALCRAAMAGARNPDRGFLTGRQELAGGAGFLMCIPVYLEHAGMAGWVSMRFGMADLMFGMLGDVYREDAIAIHDGEEISDRSLMYRSSTTIHSSDQLSAIRHIEVAGHYWTLSVAQEYPGTPDGGGQAHIVLYAGIGMSLLLSFLSWTLLRGRAQAVTEAAGMEQELAERRRAHKQLQLAATVYDTMDEAVAVTDADNRLVSVNPAFTAITGYSWKEVAGKNPSILSSGLQPPEFYREMWGSLNSAGAWQGEISNRRKNGEIFVEWLSIKRVADRSGHSCCYIAVFSDISKRKAAENLLRESSETLRAVIETAMDAVVLTDSSGIITEWNARAEDILGWSREEACGRDLENMVAPFRYQDGSVSTLRQFLMLGNGTAAHSLIETTAIHRDGRQFPVELTVATIRIRGKRGFSCFIHDVSARRERDEALQAANIRAEAASRAKSDFLANMSHEIRTPMNSILGMAYLALKTELDDKQRDYLEKIHYSGQHLLGIINDILDFSKIEAGKLKIEIVDIDLHKLIGNTINMLGGKAAEKGLTLDFSIDGATPLHLRGDPLRLGQVLINYVSNAIKFTEAGGVSIRAAVQESYSHHLLLRMEVRDSGMGIDADDMPKLFHLFQQADSSTTRKFGGTGLGLAISKQLAELMGGEVGVESEPGKGSTFWFTAMLGKVPDASLGTAETDAQAVQVRDAQRAIAGAQILLVEDNHFNQLVATDLLEGVGARVSIAGNGKEALDILRCQRFDCVLMDMQMPEMDGLEASRRIRADAGIADVLIIAMTANTRSEDRARCLEAGMDDLITKPILPEMFYATLAGYLTRQSYGPGATAVSGGKQGDGEVIDLDVLSSMVGHDREKVRKYAGKFLAVAEEGLHGMQQALAHADMPALAALGHRIKSSARTVGAAGFASLCQSLEHPGLAPEQARETVGGMSGLLERIREKVGEVQDE